MCLFRARFTSWQLAHSLEAHLDGNVVQLCSNGSLLNRAIRLLIFDKYALLHNLIFFALLILKLGTLNINDILVHDDEID